MKFQDKAFSLTELLTTVAIVGTLSVVGIKSYQKQSNEAKTAEAKKVLSYVYSAERNFYNNWGGYHENLAVVGASPTGLYSYDIGFGKSAPLASNYGDLTSYPKVGGANVLNERACTNYYQICQGTCLSNLASAVGSMYAQYFMSGGPYHATANCQVDSKVLLKDYTGSLSNSEASKNAFKALATGKLKGRDVWSINEKQEIKHEEDGI